MKLIALPYAFGNSAVYYPLEKFLSKEIKLIPVEYAGHFQRYKVPLCYSIRDMALDVYNEISDEINEDYALLGYSMGGIVAYELFNLIRQKGRLLPKHIFLFAANDPEFPHSYANYEEYSTQEIKEVLKTFENTPKKLLEDDYILGLVSPFVKSDCIAVRDYVPKSGSEYNISVPVTLLRGDQEKDVEHCKEGWAKYCSADFTYKVVPGGHFFLFEENGKRMAEYAKLIEDIILPENNK